MKQPTPLHKFYVYQYIDPRPHKNRAVIYVGKGTHTGGGRLKRMEAHWSADGLKNQLFGRVLQKIRGLGLSPVRVVVSWHESEVDAFASEIMNIGIHGLRRDGGTLCNLTYGGEGAVGMIHGAETLLKIGRASQQFWQNEDYAARRKASQRKYFDNNPEAVAARAIKTSEAWTPEMKAAQGASVKARGPEFAQKVSASLRANPEFLARSSELGKTVLQDPALIARRKITLKATMSTTEFREELSTRVKAALATPEAKANQKAASKKMWADPEYKAKMLAIRAKPITDETRKKLSDAMKSAAANASPETKAKVSAFRSQMATERHARNRAAKLLANPPVEKPPKIKRPPPAAKATKSQASTAIWSDPEFKAKTSAAIKAAKTTPEARARVSVKNTEIWSAPEVREKFSARMKEVLNNPEEKARKAAATKALWADPAFREKMRIARLAKKQA